MDTKKEISIKYIAVKASIEVMISTIAKVSPVMTLAATPIEKFTKSKARKIGKI